MTMTIMDQASGKRGTAQGAGGALLVRQDPAAGVQHSITDVGSVTLSTKVQTDGGSQVTAVGALAANTDFFTAAVQCGVGAVLNALKVHTSANGTMDVLEIQIAAAAAGPWYPAGSGFDRGLARTVTADMADTVIGTRGIATLPYARVRYRSVAAVATGASIALCYEKSGR